MRQTQEQPPSKEAVVEVLVGTKKCEPGVGRGAADRAVSEIKSSLRRPRSTREFADISVGWIDIPIPKRIHGRKNDAFAGESRAI